MDSRKTREDQEFVSTINEIGKIIHERFLDTLYEKVTDKDLLQMFNHLESYWFDRDRSALIWFCNEIVGGVPEKTITLGLVISMTSSGIGIHDDIIDKNQMKRFEKTIPAKYRPEKALVAGDLLIIKGLTELESLFSEYCKDTSHSLIGVFREYFSEIAAGEMWEINANKNLEMELDAYHEMVWKLGVDVEACAKLGAISGNATGKEIEALSFFGRALGYIIRLLDEIKDILNIDGNLRNRIKYESIPLAILLVAKQSNKKYSTISEIINKNKLEIKDIEKLINMSYDANVFNYINEKIHKTYEEAVNELQIFPDSHAKSMLLKILELKMDQSNIKY